MCSNGNTVICDGCGKDSGFTRVGSDGTTGALIKRIGWVVKLPIMVGIPKWFFCCSDDCMRKALSFAYEEHGVTEEQKAEAKAILDKAKAKIPQMAAETAAFMTRLQKTLRNHG